MRRSAVYDFRDDYSSHLEGHLKDIDEMAGFI